MAPAVDKVASGSRRSAWQLYVVSKCHLDTWVEKAPRPVLTLCPIFKVSREKGKSKQNNLRRIATNSGGNREGFSARPHRPVRPDGKTRRERDNPESHDRQLP